MLNSINLNYQNYQTFPQNKNLVQNSNSAGINSTQNSTPNSQSTTSSNFALDKNEAVSKVLGYGVDSEGYFTSDFNEAIGLPKDYKIHSLSIENFLSYENGTSFSKLDLEKTLQNAYKLFSQLIDESKTSFSKEDLNAISQAFDFDKNSLQITQKYHFSQSEYKSFLNGSFANEVSSGNIISTMSFFSFDDKPLGENLFTYTPFNANESAYRQGESVSKGGLFVAFLGNQKLNYYVAEGQTNLFGKLQGLDKTMSEAEFNELHSLVSEYGQYFDISELYFNVLRSDMSVDEFKELALAKKEAFLKQNESSAVNSLNDTTGVENASNAEDNEEKDKKSFTPIQAESGRETYKDLSGVKNLELAKIEQMADMLAILFGQNKGSNSSSFYQKVEGNSGLSNLDFLNSALGLSHQNQGLNSTLSNSLFSNSAFSKFAFSNSTFKELQKFIGSRGGIDLRA